jgi:hypothetical protein
LDSKVGVSTNPEGVTYAFRNLLLMLNTVGLCLVGTSFCLVGRGLFAGQAGGRPLGPPLIPYWRTDQRPLYHSPSPEGGPSSADTVDLVTGSLEHETEPDVESPNRFGPDFEFSRVYTTALALLGRHASGMTPGWHNTYSFTGLTTNAAAWSGVGFVDPKGATEIWQPILKDGSPTGEFPAHPGTDFFLKGEPSSTTGKWNSLTWQYDGNEKWVFLPHTDKSGTYYLLAQMVAINGTSITLNYDADRGNRLTSVLDNAGTTMMTCQYGPDDMLDSVTSSTGYKVYYGYTVQAGFPCLTTVSLRVDGPAHRDQVAWKYGYTAIRQRPFLTEVMTPAGPQAQLATHHNIFDPVTGKETKFIDANGIETSFTYH